MIFSRPVPLDYIQSIANKLSVINPEITNVEKYAVRYVLIFSSMDVEDIAILEHMDKMLWCMINALTDIHEIENHYHSLLLPARTLLPQQKYDIDDYKILVQEYKQPPFFGATPQMLNFEYDDFLKRFVDYLNDVVRIICSKTADKLVDMEAMFMGEWDDIQYAIQFSGTENMVILQPLAKEIQYLRMCFLEAEAAFMINMENVQCIMKNCVIAALLEEDKDA